MNIRAYLPGDLAELHRINADNQPAVGPVTRDELEMLIGQSFYTLVVDLAGDIAGFVVCLAEGADYGSLNYAWVSERFPAFAYVDRVAVAEAHRGRGIGKQLYAALEAHIGDERPVLSLEVNELPPNPGSLRFHQAIGFETIGRRAYDDGAKAVIYMSEPLSG